MHVRGVDDQHEGIIRKERTSWLIYYNFYIVIAVLCVLDILSGTGRFCPIFIIVGIIFVSMKRLQYLFIVTSQRVIVRKGIIARNTNEIRLNNIRNLNVRQGAIERILNVGTVIVISAADGGAKVVFTGVQDPHGLKEKIHQLTL